MERFAFDIDRYESHRMHSFRFYFQALSGISLVSALIIFFELWTYTREYPLTIYIPAGLAALGFGVDRLLDLFTAAKSGRLTIGVDGVCCRGEFIPWPEFRRIKKLGGTRHFFTLQTKAGDYVRIRCADVKLLTRASAFAEEMWHKAQTSAPQPLAGMGITAPLGSDPRDIEAAISNLGYRKAIRPGAFVRVATHPAASIEERAFAVSAAMAAGASEEEKRTLVRVADALVDEEAAEAVHEALRRFERG